MMISGRLTYALDTQAEYAEALANITTNADHTVVSQDPATLTIVADWQVTN